MVSVVAAVIHPTQPPVCEYLSVRYADALANVLFGNVAPSGRLPITLPNKDNEVGGSSYRYLSSMHTRTDDP